MTNTLAPHTEAYTSVSTLIANLKAAKRTAQPQTVAVGQRVEVCMDGVMQTGTVQEIHPVTGFVRVAGDLAWQHQWLPAQDVVSAPTPTPAEGQSPVAPFGPQEPPNDYRIYNRRQPDGTYPPLSGFFDKPMADRKPELEVGARVNVPALGIAGKLVAVKPSRVVGGVTVYRIGWLEGKAQDYREAGFWMEDIEVVAAKSR